MNQNIIIEKVRNWVENDSNKENSAHDWWHTWRVLNLALKINKVEQGDEFIISMIALLHDVYDWKVCGDINVIKALNELFEYLNIKDSISTNNVKQIINDISKIGFHGGFKKKHLSKDGIIVQDADRLDAIGAIAIARTFAYGGKVNRVIYDPNQGIIEIQNEDDYKNLSRHSINHFYEKLLRLKELIQTPTARAIAEQRHAFMEQYLEQFFQEWENIL